MIRGDESRLKLSVSGSQPELFSEKGILTFGTEVEVRQLWKETGHLFIQVRLIT